VPILDQFLPGEDGKVCHWLERDPDHMAIRRDFRFLLEPVGRVTNPSRCHDPRPGRVRNIAIGYIEPLVLAKNDLRMWARETPFGSCHQHQHWPPPSGAVFFTALWS
jgi:hypothetical protein